MNNFFASLKRRIGGMWQSSLALRVVVVTLVSSIVVLFAGGYLLVNQVQRGIIDAKRESAEVEATAVFSRLQAQLNDGDLRTEALLERLGHMAEETGSEPSRYSIIIETPATVYLSGGVQPSSVPDDLRAQVEAEPTDMWSTLTRIEYLNIEPAAGIAVGGHLVAPSGQYFPVYMLFPATAERETLAVFNSALWTTAVVLVAALTAVAFLIARQVTVPVRKVRDIAYAISGGALDERVEVVGTDELASLGASVNSMAATLQAQIVQLEDLSRLQHRFVSDVSHELRTPLTTTRMAADTLYDSKESFDPVSQRTVELLHTEVDRFESMLADLLEISRFDAGAAQLVCEPTDLTELVAGEIEAHTAMAAKAGSEIRLHRNDVHADIDRRRVRRIVRNLIGNAIEHGQGNPIDVYLAAHADAAAVVVRDYGVGLTEEENSHVFDRFWRADPSRTRLIGGTGLGLSIAAEDANLHGGSLDSHGEPGNGASFRLTLPLKQGHPITHSPLEIWIGEDA